MGAECLPILAATYDSAIALVRRPIAGTEPRVVQRVIDFDRIAELKGTHVDDIFCALGTTIRKAGSKDAFRKVDYGYPLAAANWGRANGAKQFVLVSSAGAAAASSNFYLSVKGELEDQLAGLGFASLRIFRPSMLLGARGETRPGERLGQWAVRGLHYALAGPLEKYRGMPAGKLAIAMAAAAAAGEPGRRVYHWREIMQLAGK